MGNGDEVKNDGYENGAVLDVSQGSDKALILQLFVLCAIKLSGRASALVAMLPVV